MLKISSGLQIDEIDAPRVFADVLENDGLEIVKLIVETVLTHGTGSMKVSLLNAISFELSRQLVLKQQQPTEFEKAAIESGIKDLRTLHGRAIKATAEIFGEKSDGI